ncbi:helix-turn-helix transcriptional regulator [Streptococcus sp. 121]|uniref:helix-turn-helix domain-containing protein n=1 Tax=Streptococcus sp. 121 TaxID=2797637 RepID=UPI0018F05D99|nr:helix-turn-helix transcriptional regulator [Streptococcus sp. 121]MBJ6746163.1 helix-turn-helix transcriptional regulator [Streptococcus sp. 121]
MTNNINFKEFVARQIRLLRLERGFTQEQLAETADLGFNYVYRLENKNLNVKIETLEKIMIALDVDIQTFFNIEKSQQFSGTTELLNELETLPEEKQKIIIDSFLKIISQLK